MRKHLTYSLGFLFILLAYGSSSCGVAKKQKEKRIIGFWNVVNVLEIAPNTTRQWEFDAAGIVTVRVITDTSTNIVDEGIWSINQKVTVAHLETTFGTIASVQSGISVKWDILSLKKTTMYLTHQEGGILTREFERANN